jgi:hypothetical protein
MVQQTGKFSILDGWVDEDQFAADNQVAKRTVARYRNQPSGLPYVEWGGKVYINVQAAREWLQSRLKRRNQSHRHTAA